MNHPQTDSIMIVDDDDIEAMMLERAINRHQEGVYLHRARNGAEALDLLKAERPDLVLLDVRMPIMDGHEALSQIKSNPEWRDIPVVMMSTSTNPDDIGRGYANHANAYLVKALTNETRTRDIDNLLNFWLETVAH